ncbi:MAG: hypothetical protein LBV70_06445 [Candidatus Adiutrix sp.]|jgi:hypothetical protein|nr:hypothetical protein [Candidatus Adiutrix sp.]
MIILTIDTDWAPAWATLAVLDRVRALGLKVTVFFSRPNPAPPWPLLEIGAHPDLSRRHVPADGDDPLAMATPEHDQGVLEAEAGILAAYRGALPEAYAVRTHRFYWHSDLSRVMSRAGFLHDSSMILPYQPGLTGFKVGRLTRWPVWGSDQLHLTRRYPLDRLELPGLDRPGLKIYCFHVAYLYLNARSLADFDMIKTRLGEDEKPAVRPGPGVWDFFERLAERAGRETGGLWLKDIPAEFVWRGHNENSGPGI